MSAQPSLPLDAEALRARFAAGERFDFLCFWGHRRRADGVPTPSCFSQWYEAPFEFDDVRYVTAEHYMMAEKARLFGDRDALARILAAKDPGAAKAFGRQVRSYREEDWVERRFEIVVRGNRAKFGQWPDLGDFLRKTGRKVLVEASPLDRIWGVGLAADDARAQDPGQWQGLNLLGFALMAVRETLRDPGR